MTPPSKLHAKQIGVSLGGQTILHTVDVSIGPKELIAVVGANGAGKTTLLRTLAGLQKLSSGSVELDERALDDFTSRERAKRIAFLPQDRTVHWSLDVKHVVGLGRLPHRAFAAAPSNADKRAVDTAMRRVDVTKFSERPIATLSGGEQARVLLARALAQNAQFLIVDEPAAGLDVAHALAIFSEFERQTNDGRAVIAAIHDLILAARFATRILVMHKGACIADGPPAQVLSTDTLKRAFDTDFVRAEVDGITVIVPRLQ